MATNLVSLLTNAFKASPRVNVTNPVVTQTSNNPYSNNPFVNYNGNRYNQFYAQNKPVKGGYFAGYYNGKQNIVGRRLFVEV
ncbi:hypothetical protein IKL64_00945 [bacterium]|jgi:hypothetical protein|nr:hypothetical protein [bacterium]MBO5447185.1 hypothetical protein [bacterium]MBR6722003.1 hypothetical protein [bacterium]